MFPGICDIFLKSLWLPNTIFVRQCFQECGICFQKVIWGLCHLPCPTPGAGWNQIWVDLKAVRQRHQDLNIATGLANDHRWSLLLVGGEQQIF